MLAREHRDTVGANLVRRVAVRRDPIGADDDEIDAALPHQCTNHSVGDDGRRDPVAHELPRRESRALQKRPGLVGEYGDLLAGGDGAANDAERRPVPSRRKRARVAVRQHPGVRRHHFGAERTHRAAARDIFVVNGLRFAVEARFDLIDRLAGLGAGSERAIHAIDGPEQVDGGGAGRRHQLADLVELRRELLRAGRLALSDAERDPHRGGDANCRRAANDHRLDRPRHFSGGLAADVDLCRGQLSLVDHHDRVVFLRDGRKHLTILHAATASGRQTARGRDPPIGVCLCRGAGSRG